VDEAIKGVGLGYGRQLYFRFLLKYMVICAFENHPSIPCFLETQIVYIGYGQSYLSIAVQWGNANVLHETYIIQFQYQF
jgi:hypothetical protein